jgi:VPS inhibitor protein D
LSGGGSKGIAYAGMVQALEKTKTLQNLTHICGASAGAMSASLIAMGVNSEDFTKIVSNVNLMDLLDIQRLRGKVRAAFAEAGFF